MSTIKVVNIQHPDSVDPNLVLQADGDTVFASGLTVSGVFDIANDLTVSGNTGLGTSSPTSKLHVVDTTTNLQLESTANSSSGKIDFIGKDASSNSYRTLTIDTSSTGTLNIETDPDNGGYSTDKSILFKQAGTESMRIDANGNVGIGRSSPGAKLDVSGDLVLNDASAVTNQKLAINKAIQSDNIVAILQNVNSNFGDDANVDSLDFDLNYSGSTTFTGNRTHHGLYIDFDNNQTGHSGTSGNRLLSYGARIICDWNEGAHTSSVLRLTSTVDKKVDGGTNTQEGIVNAVNYNNSFDAAGITVTQNIKALHQDIIFSSVNNSGVNIYGTDTLITITGTETNTINAVYGHYTILSTPTNATNYTITNSYGCYVQNDYDGISSYTNSYLYYGSYSTGAVSALTGERRGIWIVNATHNQIEGRLLVGDVGINSYDADADNLLIGEVIGGNNGLSIISGNTSTGNIYFADGTGTTGEKVGRIVYDHNDDSLHFVTNSAEALRIDSSGNVGIGTSSPATLLELEKNGATQLRLTRTNAVSNYCQIEAAGTNSEQLTITTDPTGQGAGFIAFENGGSERMRIDSSGNVGIGTSSPASPLEVVAPNSAGLTEVLRLKKVNTDTVVFRVDLDPDANIVKYAATGNQAASHVFGTGGTGELLRIQPNGNVGIGTSSPGEKLDVKGNINASADAGTNVSIRVNEATTGAAFIMQQSATENTIESGASIPMRIGTTGAQSLVLKVNNTDRLTVINGGNVGIGTTNPSEKLEVNGTIKATDINFTGLATYADDAAAGAGGLVAGDVYKTSTGELRIKL